MRVAPASLPSTLPRFLYAPSLSVHTGRGWEKSSCNVPWYFPFLAISSYRDIASESAYNPLHARTDCIWVFGYGASSKDAGTRMFFAKIFKLKLSLENFFKTLLENFYYSFFILQTCYISLLKAWLFRDIRSFKEKIPFDKSTCAAYTKQFYIPLKDILLYLDENRHPVYIPRKRLGSANVILTWEYFFRTPLRARGEPPSGSSNG